MSRTTIPGSSPYEAIVGYSRAVRVGNHISVAGTTATNADGQLVGEGDAYLQTRQILANIGLALEQAGADFGSVTRTRIFVTDIQRDWEAVGQAHGEVFAIIRPACTMVQVAALIDPRMLVEIEVEAWVEK